LVSGKSRIYVRSFGCSTNFADGEIIRGCLAKHGYRLANDIIEADILVYNTCAVKTPTENKIMEILRASPNGKKLVVTGCLPLINFPRLRAEVKFEGALGPAPGMSIVEAVRKVERGKRVVDLRDDSMPSCTLPKMRRNQMIEILPISYGCLGECAYCCVRFARGKLRSYRVQEILKRIQRALQEGVKEVWLTAQDSACYGRDIGTNLVALLKRIVDLDGEFWVRAGMMNPNNALDMLPELVDVYKDEKIFKFLHLPIQSGDDEILRLMNRAYSVKDFKKIVSAFRRETPRMTIATDFLCGFSSESEQAFERSLELIEDIRPDVVNVSKFFVRPRTVAGRMKQIAVSTIKERSARMSELARRIAFENNQKWVGWSGRILVDEKGKNESWIGRNYAYKPVVVRHRGNLLGKMLDVQIKNAFTTYLEAEMLSG